MTFEQGELKTFAAHVNDGSALYRHFCPNCGSALMVTLDRYPEIRSMMGGTLDDKSMIKPAFSFMVLERPAVVDSAARDRVAQ